MPSRFHNIWPHHTASTLQPSLEHLLRGGRGADGTGCAHSLGTSAWCHLPAAWCWPGTAASRASRSRSEGSSLLRRAQRCHQQGSSARLPGALGACRVGVVQLEVGWLGMGCGGRAGLPRLVRLVCGCAGDTSRAPRAPAVAGSELGMSPDFGEKRDSRFLLPTRGAENRSAPALRGEQAGPGPQPRVLAAAPCVGLCGVGWAAVRGCGGHGAARPSSRPTGAARPQALRCRLSLISIPAV